MKKAETGQQALEVKQETNMGQSQIGPSTLQRPDSQYPAGVAKVFRVRYREWSCTIAVEDDTLTCGWLLSEVLRRSPGSVISLATRKNVEILDYWLTRMERSLQPLANGEELEPIFAGTHLSS
jgi:hypothetical protein